MLELTNSTVIRDVWLLCTTLILGEMLTFFGQLDCTSNIIIPTKSIIWQCCRCLYDIWHFFYVKKTNMLSGDNSIEYIGYNTITCGNGKWEKPRNEKLVILMVILGEQGHQGNGVQAWRGSACLQTANQPHVRWCIHKKPNAHSTYKDVKLVTNSAKNGDETERCKTCGEGVQWNYIFFSWTKLTNKLWNWLGRKEDKSFIVGSHIRVKLPNIWKNM